KPCCTASSFTQARLVAQLEAHWRACFEGKPLDNCTVQLHCTMLTRTALAITENHLSVLVQLDTTANTQTHKRTATARNCMGELNNGPFITCYRPGQSEPAWWCVHQRSSIAEPYSAEDRRAGSSRCPALR